MPNTETTAAALPADALTVAEVETLVRRLTAAQRAAVLWLPEDGRDKSIVPYRNHPPPPRRGTIKALHALGLVPSAWEHATGTRATPLGLQVQAALKLMGGDGQ